MFSELLESVAAKKQTRKGWAVMASAILQSLCLMITFLIPLIYTQALPKTRANAFLIAPAPSLRPASPPQDTAPTVRQTARLLEHNILREPTSIPKNIAMTQEPPLPPEAPTDFRADASSSFNLLENIPAGPAGPAAPAPPLTPPSPAPIVPQRIKQGGAVQAAKLIDQPQPIYPVLARQARMQGVVLLHAVVNKNGNVAELQVISGPPLLVRAALDAVRQWRYQPTLLNGEPVEVETTITVSFVLGG